jgi:hypothetical protein
LLARTYFNTGDGDDQAFGGPGDDLVSACSGGDYVRCTKKS